MNTEPKKKAYRKRHLFPRSLAAVTEKITAPMLDGNQHMLRMFMRDWPQIVGEALAEETRPSKLHFTKQEQTDGTLHVRVAPHKAPELPYITPQIIESIARYVGFKAVGRIVVDPWHKE